MDRDKAHIAAVHPVSWVPWIITDGGGLALPLRTRQRPDISGHTKYIDYLLGISAVHIWL